jgi:hypothetical protein
VSIEQFVYFFLSVRNGAEASLPGAHHHHQSPFGYVCVYYCRISNKAVCVGGGRWDAESGAATPADVNLGKLFALVFAGTRKLFVLVFAGSFAMIWFLLGMLDQDCTPIAYRRGLRQVADRQCFSNCMVRSISHHILLPASPGLCLNFKCLIVSGTCAARSR